MTIAISNCTSGAAMLSNDVLAGMIAATASNAETCVILLAITMSTIFMMFVLQCVQITLHKRETTNVLEQWTRKYGAAAAAARLDDM